MVSGPAGKRPPTKQPDGERLVSPRNEQLIVILANLITIFGVFCAWLVGVDRQKIGFFAILLAIGLLITIQLFPGYSKRQEKILQILAILLLLGSMINSITESGVNSTAPVPTIKIEAWIDKDVLLQLPDGRIVSQGGDKKKNFGENYISKMEVWSASQPDKRLIDRIPAIFGGFTPGETIYINLCGFTESIDTYTPNDSRFRANSTVEIPVPQSMATNCPA